MLLLIYMAFCVVLVIGGGMLIAAVLSPFALVLARLREIIEYNCISQIVFAIIYLFVLFPLFVATLHTALKSIW